MDITDDTVAQLRDTANRALDNALRQSGPQQRERWGIAANKLLSAVVALDAALKGRENSYLGAGRVSQVTYVAGDERSLDDDFTNTKPCGAILEGTAADTAAIPHWRDLYVWICSQLFERNPELFRTLPDNYDFYGSERFYFGGDGDLKLLKRPARVGAGVHAETNLPANRMRDNIRKLLSVFDIPETALQVFTRPTGRRRQRAHRANRS